MMDEHDLAIGNYRSTHGAALYDKAHAEHALRTAELTKLYDAKFSGAGVARLASPEPPSPASEKEPDRVVDPAARLAEPAQQPTDYDFQNLATPFGLETTEDTELERWSREWLHAGQVSPAEGRALGQLYADSLAWDVEAVERMAEQSGRDLRIRYGAETATVAAAALRVCDDFPELSVFLNDSGLINHPRVIDNLVRVAEQRGYLRSGKNV
jgi:hypothetical protein